MKVPVKGGCLSGNSTGCLLRWLQNLTRLRKEPSPQVQTLAKGTDPNPGAETPHLQWKPLMKNKSVLKAVAFVAQARQGDVVS